MGNVSFVPRTRTRRSWAAAFTGRHQKHKTSTLGLILWGMRTCISGCTKAWTELRERGSPPTLARLGALLTSRSSEYKPLQADNFRRTLIFQNSTKGPSCASRILPYSGRIQPNTPECDDRALVGSGMHVPPSPTLQCVGEDTASPGQASLHLCTPSLTSP